MEHKEPLEGIAMNRKLYQEIAILIKARFDLTLKQNNQYIVNFEDKIKTLTKEHFPSGSGFDGFYFFDLEYRPNTLVFFAEFHHMNDVGYYDGWSTMKAVIKPDITSGIDFKLTGINRKYRHLKDDFEEMIYSFLTKDIEI